MSNPTRVAAMASDPISAEGLAGLLRRRPEVDLVAAPSPDEVDVLVYAARREPVTDMLPDSYGPIVVITGSLRGVDPTGLVERGVVDLLPRPAVSDRRLVRAVLAATAVASPTVDDLVERFERLSQQCGTPAGVRLSPREIEVLRLVADGWQTAQIAQALRYSERTVSKLIQRTTSRLGLRNRSHAVAYALRAGVI